MQLSDLSHCDVMIWLLRCFHRTWSQIETPLLNGGLLDPRESPYHLTLSGHVSSRLLQHCLASAAKLRDALDATSREFAQGSSHLHIFLAKACIQKREGAHTPIGAPMMHSTTLAHQLPVYKPSICISKPPKDYHEWISTPWASSQKVS